MLLYLGSSYPPYLKVLYIIEYVRVAVEVKLLDVNDKDHYLRMPFQERFSEMQAMFPDNILNPVTY